MNPLDQHTSSKHAIFGATARRTPRYRPSKFSITRNCRYKTSSCRCARRQLGRRDQWRQRGPPPWRISIRSFIAPATLKTPR